MICQCNFQIYDLLPTPIAFDLMYNRFVNTKGNAVSNVEEDRKIEHWNRRFKKDCKAFNNKVTINQYYSLVV